MSLLCSTNCAGAGAITAYCDPCEIGTRQSGGSYIHFVKCGYQFVDILDAAEWTAARTAGNVISFPRGAWTLPAPTVTNEEVTGCGIQVETSRTYEMPFETVCAVSNGNDFVFWSTINDDYLNYRVVMESCDGLFYVADSYFDAVRATPAGPALVTGETPGLSFSFSVAPYENREGNNKTLVKWASTLSIVKTGLIKAIALPGVSTALSA